MGTPHELTSCSLLWFLKTNLRSVPCEIIQLYENWLENLITKFALIPRQVPTGTTDTTRTVTERQCCARKQVHEPVYSGCVMHICGLVRHECVDGGGWFLHRIGISIIHANLRFFPYKTKVGMYYILPPLRKTSCVFFTCIYMIK